MFRRERKDVVKDLRLSLGVMLALLSMLVLLGCQQAEPLPTSTPTPLPTPTPKPTPTATPIPLPTAYAPHEWHRGMVFGGNHNFGYNLDPEVCVRNSPPKCIVRQVWAHRKWVSLFIPEGYVVDVGTGRYEDNCTPDTCRLVPLPKGLQETGAWRDLPMATYTPDPTDTFTPEPTATPTPLPTATLTPDPTATFTPKPMATLEFIPDGMSFPWGDSTVTRLGYMGDWVIMASGRSPRWGWNYGRGVRNPLDAPQQYTCVNYPDERGNVPRVNLTMPYPVVFTEGLGELEYRVKATTLVGDQEVPVSWKTWETRHDRLFLKNRDARQLMKEILDQQAQAWTLILPDNPEIKIVYSVAGIDQALQFNDMLRCFRQ